VSRSVQNEIIITQKSIVRVEGNRICQLILNNGSLTPTLSAYGEVSVCKAVKAIIVARENMLAKRKDLLVRIRLINFQKKAFEFNLVSMRALDEKTLTVSKDIKHMDMSVNNSTNTSSLGKSITGFVRQNRRVRAYADETDNIYKLVSAASLARKLLKPELLDVWVKPELVNLVFEESQEKKSAVLFSFKSLQL